MDELKGRGTPLLAGYAVAFQTLLFYVVNVNVGQSATVSSYSATILKKSVC